MLKERVISFDYIKIKIFNARDNFIIKAKGK